MANPTSHEAGQFPGEADYIETLLGAMTRVQTMEDARKLWAQYKATSPDSRRIEQGQEARRNIQILRKGMQGLMVEAMGANSFPEGHAAWNTKLAELAHAKNQLEVMSDQVKHMRDQREQMRETLDRAIGHVPVDNKTVQDEFIKLNKKIGILVANAAITEFANFANNGPLNTWDPEVFFEDSINNALGLVPIKANKFLLRNAIWNFFSKKLLDAKMPFECFGSVMARECGHIYLQLYPVPERSMDACRWRATTVRTLREIETPTDTMRKVNELMSEFRTMVREKMTTT